MGARAGPPVRGLWEQLCNYVGAIRWLACRLWASFRWRLIRAVAAAQLGVVVVGAGLSLSLHYAQRLERDERLQLGELALSARDETTLALVVVVVLVVLLLGGGLLFSAQRAIDKMAVSIQHHVRMDVALAYGGELPEAADWRNDQSVWRALWVLQTRDARRISIVTRKLLRNTTHVGIAAVGLGALFYLEARMTVLLLAVMSAALVAYYYANRISVRATRRYEAVAPDTRRALHQLLRSVQTVSQPRLRREEFEGALGHEALAEEAGAFRDRFGAHVYTELLGFAIMGVVFAGLSGYLGREALAGSVPWTRLVAYLVVLRITLSGVFAIFSTIAFFSRFYPAIRRLNRFFSATNGSLSGDPVEELRLQTSAETMTENEAMTQPVPKGEMVGVVLPVSLSRYSLGLLASLFCGGNFAQRRRMLGKISMATRLSEPPTAASMESLVMLDGRWDPRWLRERLGDQADPIEEAIGLDPSVAVPPESWAKLSPEATARLVLVAAEASDRPVLAIDRDLATPEWLERLRQQAGDKILLLCSSGEPTFHDGFGIERSVVASVYGGVLAIGSEQWVGRHWEGICERRMDVAVSDVPPVDDFDDEE